MKYCLITAAVALLSFSCERKETTIIPAAEKETTVITPAPAPATTIEKKTETERTIGPDGITTETKETTIEEK